MSRMCFNCMKMTEDGDFCAYCGKKPKTAPAHHLQPGTTLNGKYVIGYALGEGGFGVTYAGLDDSLQIKVAIKEFFPKGIVGRNAAVSSNVECLNSAESGQLFAAEKAKVINEARILAKFSKERGIVNVREYFEANNTAYIVMEFLEGETLEEYLKHTGPLSADQAFELLHPVMKVLEKLHNENVVHRDISPDNLMFDGQELKLLDFGAAREVLYSTSKSFSVILKHGYAPEEQYRRKGHQGSWTDVYSLAATLYCCITNTIPDTSLDRMHEDELQKPTDLGFAMAPHQEAALMRGLSVLPEDRLQKVGDFIAAWNGEYVPLPNPEKETVAAFYNGTPNTNRTGNGKPVTAGGTVFGGQVNFADTNSDERRVSGYYSDASQPTEPPKKSKKGLIIGIVSGVVALLLIVAIVIAMSLGGNKNNPDDNDISGTTSGTSQTTGTSSTETSDTETSDTEATVPEDKYKAYLDKADELAQQNKFDEALAELSTAEQLYGAEPRITTKAAEIRKDKGLYELSKYESSSDYKGAIKYIDGNMSEFKSEPDVVSKRNLYITKYRQQILSQAETTFKSSGYAKAIEVLNSSVDVIPGDAEIEAAIEKYSAYAPISVADLEYFSGYDFGKGNNIKDNLGNIHNNVVYPQCRGWSNAATTNVYKINKQYSKLTGLWFQNYDSRTATHGSPKEGDLEIYGDGRLLYSGTMKPGVEPIKLNLNISGVTELKIHYFGGGTDGSHSGIADFCVQK